MYKTSSFHISLHNEHLHLKFCQFKLQHLSISQLSVSTERGNICIQFKEVRTFTFWEIIKQRETLYLRNLKIFYLSLKVVLLMFNKCILYWKLWKYWANYRFYRKSVCTLSRSISDKVFLHKLVRQALVRSFPFVPIRLSKKSYLRQVLLQRHGVSVIYGNPFYFND